LYPPLLISKLTISNDLERSLIHDFKDTIASRGISVTAELPVDCHCTTCDCMFSTHDGLQRCIRGKVDFKTSSR